MNPEQGCTRFMYLNRLQGELTLLFKVDPQYWCKIVVKLYFVLINNIMRNGNVIGKIFLVNIHCEI